MPNLVTTNELSTVSTATDHTTLTFKTRMSLRASAMHLGFGNFLEAIKQSSLLSAIVTHATNKENSR